MVHPKSVTFSAGRGSQFVTAGWTGRMDRQDGPATWSGRQDVLMTGVPHQRFAGSTGGTLVVARTIIDTCFLVVCMQFASS